MNILQLPLSFSLDEIKKAIEQLKEMDTLLTKISTTSRMTSSDLEKLGADSYAAANEYGRQAAEYLENVLTALQASYENAPELAKLSTAIQSAGDMTSELANRYIMAADHAYQLGGSIEELTKLLDGSYSVTTQNAVSLSELAEGMSVVGADAAALGLQADETTAALGTMLVNTQQSGSESANAFKAILYNLQQLSSEENGITADGLAKYEDACNALNVKLRETKNGVTALRDPMTVIQELAAAYSSLEKQDSRKSALLDAVGGGSNAEGLRALLENYGMYETMLQEYANGTGSLAAAAQTNADSWEGSLNRLSNTWAETIGTIADSDSVTAVLNGFNDILSVINNATDNLGSLGAIGAGAGLFAGLKNVGVA